MTHEGEVTLKLHELLVEVEDKGLAYQYAAKKLKSTKAGQEAQETFYKKEAQKHARRAQSIDNELERLKDRLAEGMRATRKTEFQTVLGQIYFQDFPNVELPPDLARAAYEAAESNERYVNKKVAFEPKKTVLLDDFKKHLADFSKALPEAEAWKAAIEQMPEGFSVERNTKLMGV